MKAGGRLRFFVALTSILAATALVGALVYAVTFDTLRKAYGEMLAKTVDQGAYLVDNYLHTQRTLLALYATVPAVQEGRFTNLPVWLKETGHPGTTPKRLAILDQEGRGISTKGDRFEAGDRPYFLRARAGLSNIAGPVASRIDGIPVVVLAEPVPGDHPRAAVLTASIDLSVFQVLLGSIQGIQGLELTLTTVEGRVLASTAGPQALAPAEVLEASRPLGEASWTLKARVRVGDLLAPVRTVLFVVFLLVIAGAGLIIIFFLTGQKLRRELDEAREDRTQALRDAYEQIRKLAFHDTVTRLPNRNLLTRRIGEALQARTDLRVIVVALGRFRSLTTTFGMHFGDTVLKETAARLTAFAPAETGAIVGRLGGSEFLLLLPADRFGPEALPSLLGLFEEPMGKRDLRLHINVHIGACRLEDSGTSPEEVIKCAETALWAARDEGPNAASELTAEAVARRQRRAELQQLLPEALVRGEFDIHYQPQVLMASGQVAGYEALLRWTSPVLGPVTPDEFIPVAEETGIIVPLGYWVLDQGIVFARKLRDAGTPAVVSVNVSPVQFLHHDFLDEVTRRIGASGVEPRYLGLEITESTLMEGIDQLGPSLRKIMASGVKVSLDDFGTGYSSLNYLKDLPLHVLKIDKSFIDALEGDDRAYHLIECIIDLAHHLGLVVIAEGIETGRQRELLAEVDCDLVQGYLTGRPRPARDHLDQVPV